MKLPLYKFIPAIIWFSIITILLCLPGKDIPKIGFLEAINFDKIVHMGLFAGLVFLIYLPFSKTNLSFTIKRNYLIKMALTALFYGIAMEFVQKYFILGRSFDVTDMIADGLGAFLPILLQKTMDKIINFIPLKTQTI